MAEASNYDVVVHDISYELAIKELGFSNEDKKQEENLIVLSIVMNQKKEELEKKINGTYSKFVTDNPHLDIPSELKLSIAQDALNQVSNQGLASVSEIKIDTENTHRLFLELLSNDELNRVNSEKTTVKDKEVYEIFKFLEENREESKEINELSYEKMTSLLFNFNTDDKDLKDTISTIVKVNQYIGEIENFDEENEAAVNDPNRAYRLMTLINAVTLLGSEQNFLNRDSVGIYNRANNIKVLSDLYYLLKKNPDDEEVSKIFKEFVEKQLPESIDLQTGEIDIEKLKHYYYNITMGEKLGELENPEKNYEGYVKFANIEDAQIETVINFSKSYIIERFRAITKNKLEMSKMEILSEEAKALPIDSFLRFLEEELLTGFDSEGKVLYNDMDIPLYKKTLEDYFKITLRELIRARKKERTDFEDDDYTKENRKNIYMNIKKIYGEKIPIDIMEMMYYADPQKCKEIFGIERIEDIEKSKDVCTKAEEHDYIKSKNKEDIWDSFECSWSDQLNGRTTDGYENFRILMEKYPIESLKFLNSKVMDDKKIVSADMHWNLFFNTLQIISRNKKEGLLSNDLTELEMCLNESLDVLPKFPKSNGKIYIALASFISTTAPDVIEKKYGMSPKEFLESDMITKVNVYNLQTTSLESLIILLDNIGDSPDYKKDEIELLYKNGLKKLSDTLYHMTPNEKDRLLNTSVGKKIVKAYQTILSNTNSENLEETAKLILNSDTDMTFLPAVINQNYNKETVDMINKYLAIRQNADLKRKQINDMKENLISQSMFERLINKGNNRK